MTGQEMMYSKDRNNLSKTINNLLEMRMIPIINGNDAIAPSFNSSYDIPDNDQLAAELAISLKVDLLVLMSDVEGLYSSHPDDPDSHLLRTYYVGEDDHYGQSVQFWNKSSIGKGGMKSKLMSAEKAVKEGQAAVVIMNGCREGETILDVVNGRSIGTLITQSNGEGPSQSIDLMADYGKCYTPVMM
jgi:delta-1-pyrroline-5-carboxylate synthetase